MTADRPPEPASEPELTAGLHGLATPEPSLAYRLIRRALPLAARLIFGFRVEVTGHQHLPAAGPYVVAGLPHRVWVDPFLLWGWLPARPRLLFFGDARTMARSRWRRWVLAMVGGVIPIPTTHRPRTVELHFAAAADALAAGGVFCLFPETGPASPPDRIRRLGGGIAYVALRARAPIVPMVIGGNDELFRGRRLVVRILPPLDPWALAGISDPVPPRSREEREAAHRLLKGLAASVAEPVAAAWRDASPPPGTRRRWPWLHTLFE